MNRNRKKTIFVNSIRIPRMATILLPQAADSDASSTKGMSYPPKKSVAITAEDTIMLMYSEKRKNPSFSEEYS